MGRKRNCKMRGVSTLGRNESRIMFSSKYCGLDGSHMTKKMWVHKKVRVVELTDLERYKSRF